MSLLFNHLYQDCVVDLQSSQKVIGYPNNIYVTIATMGLSCQELQKSRTKLTKLGI